MAQEITRRRVGRLRAPRVQIAYDLTIGGEVRRKELPFVIGVLADVAGAPDPLPKKLRERAFVGITTNNLNTVMQSVRPRLAFKVPNRLADGDDTLAVALRFERLNDFEPESVAQQVEPLRRLLVLRRQLSALRSLARRDPSVQLRLRLAGTGQPPAGARGKGLGEKTG
jgi:type VI secretion system protein ImpB